MISQLTRCWVAGAEGQGKSSILRLIMLQNMPYKVSMRFAAIMLQGSDFHLATCPACPIATPCPSASHPGSHQAPARFPPGLPPGTHQPATPPPALPIPRALQGYIAFQPPTPPPALPIPGALQGYIAFQLPQSAAGGPLAVDTARGAAGPGGALYFSTRAWPETRGGLEGWAAVCRGRGRAGCSILSTTADVLVVVEGMCLSSTMPPQYEALGMRCKSGGLCRQCEDERGPWLLTWLQVGRGHLVAAGRRVCAAGSRPRHSTMGRKRCRTALSGHR
jgi:hypothetical protein